jgi:hypothetical protein
MAPGAMVAFDCRRYLPTGRAVNGNFMIAIDLPIPGDEPVTNIGARMREITASGLPLAVLGAASARAFLRNTADSTPDSRRAGVVANVMYSDLGHVTPLERLPWVAGSEPTFTGLLDPGGPDIITVFNNRISGIRRISLSFHDNVFDRHTVERVMDQLTNPVRFLPSIG